MKNMFPNLTHFSVFNILTEKPKMASDSQTKEGQTVHPLKSEHDMI